MLSCMYLYIFTGTRFQNFSQMYDYFSVNSMKDIESLSVQVEVSLTDSLNQPAVEKSCFRKNLHRITTKKCCLSDITD